MTEGPVLIASNHESFLDPPLVGIAYDQAVFYLARKTLFVGKFATQDNKKVRLKPAMGEGTLCGVVIDTNTENILANRIEQIKLGGQIGL